MKKFKTLLDDTTILNVPFYLKIAKRYYMITFLTPFLIMAFAAYFYISQFNIYSLDLGFRNAGGRSESPLQALSSLTGKDSGSGSSLSQSEIIGMARNVDFYQRLGTSLRGREDFSKLDFNQLATPKRFTSEEIFKRCNKDPQCEIEILVSILPDLYSVNSDPVIKNLFAIRTMTLDSYSTKVLLEEVKKEILSLREKAIKGEIIRQIELSKDLAQQKRNELKEFRPDELSQKKERLKSDLQSINAELTTLNNTYQNKAIQLDLSSSNIEQTQKEISNKMSKEEEQRAKRISTLEDHIKILRSDIDSLEIKNEVKTKSDSTILAELKNLLANKESELKFISKGTKEKRKNSTFIKSKDGSFQSEKFNYNVLQKQTIKLHSKIRSLQDKKNTVIAEIEAIELQTDRLRPSFEYLQLLEAKIVQLDVLLSSAVSDLVFFQNTSKMITFRRTSKVKVLVFATALALFSLLFALSFRYIFDHKIYDKYELEKNFEDLVVIGEAPRFK